jgi:hypothetical protein
MISLATRITDLIDHPGEPGALLAVRRDGRREVFPENGNIRHRTPLLN